MNNINIIIFISLYSLYNFIQKKILFIFEHSRHGIKTPSYLNDSSNLRDIFGQEWIGLKELTRGGNRMEYLLGVYLKNYYNNFFSEKYNPDEIYIMSSDSNRTVESALAQIQGIYQNNVLDIGLTNYQINRSIPYFFENKLTPEFEDFLESIENYSLPYNIQIPPIHSIDDRYHIYRISENENCEPYNYIKDDNLKKTVVKNFINNFNYTFGEHLLKKLNISDKNYFININNIDIVCDNFLSNYEIGNKLNDIFEEEKYIDFYDECIEYFTLKYKEIHIQGIKKNNIVGLISQSQIMRIILNYMKKRYDLSKKGKEYEDLIINGSPKYVMLKGHDFTISTMEDLLKIIFETEISFPSIGSSQFFVLNKISSKSLGTKYNVEIIFNDKIKLEIDFNSFEKKIKKKIWSSKKVADYCGWDEYAKEVSINTKEIVLILIIILLCLANLGIIIFICYVNNRKQKNKSIIIKYDEEYTNQIIK
jgi:hypothetical protein